MSERKVKRDDKPGHEAGPRAFKKRDKKNYY